MGIGPTPIALGRFAFQSLGFGMSELTRDLQTPWAEIDVAGRMNALHWTGPKSDAVTIKGVLFPHEWGGLQTLAGLAAAARDGEPLMLVTGSGDVGGYHVVMSISEDWTFIDARGQPRRDAYSIALRKYAPTAGFAGGMSLLMNFF